MEEEKINKNIQNIFLDLVKFWNKTKLTRDFHPDRLKLGDNLTLDSLFVRGVNLTFDFTLTGPNIEGMCSLWDL